jgi:type II secretory pathway component PulK
MIVVLLAMAMATIIFLATLKMIAVQRKTIALGARQIQAGWLADSGVERAAARLAADANYRGETWNISPEDLDGRDGGTVAIRVEDIPGKPGRRAVHVEADFPPDPQQRAREVRDVIIRTGTQP